MNGDDGDVACDSEMIDGLIGQLETSSVGHAGSSSGGTSHDSSGGEGFWSTMQTAVYMTGMHLFVREKLRVQNLLAFEIAEAEQDDDDPNTIELKGDISMYSLEQQKKRRAHKKSPGFLWAVRRLWDTTELSMNRMKRNQASSTATAAASTVVDRGANEGENVTTVVSEAVDSDKPSGGIDKNAFVDLMVKIHYLIFCPPVDREMAVQNSLADWTKDHGEGDDESVMTYDHFVESMFELVDLWTETSEEEEYAELSKLIAEGITTEAENETDAKALIAAAEAEDKFHEESTTTTTRYRLKRDEEIIFNRRFTVATIDAEDSEGDVPPQERDSGTFSGETRHAARGKVTFAKGVGRESVGGQDHGATGLRDKSHLQRAMARRQEAARRVEASPEDVDPDASLAGRSRISFRSNAGETGILSVDRVNSAIAKRMDSFVLQYHIRQFGTRKLARRNLRHLCQSVTKLGLQHPRIEIFADLVGVPVAIETKPYRERLREFRPFVCSDFVLPLLYRLCPKGEKLDRWMGNGKAPVAVTSSEFLQAIREVCPHVPLECPAMMGLTIQFGRLSEHLEQRYRRDDTQRPPPGRRGWIDLDEGLLTALPLWSCEEEYLIMHVTLHSIGVLTRWLRRSRPAAAARASETAAAAAAAAAAVDIEGGDQSASNKVSPQQRQLRPSGSKAKKRSNGSGGSSGGGNTAGNQISADGGRGERNARNTPSSQKQTNRPTTSRMKKRSGGGGGNKGGNRTAVKAEAGSRSSAGDSGPGDGGVNENLLQSKSSPTVVAAATAAASAATVPEERLPSSDDARGIEGGGGKTRPPTSPRPKHRLEEAKELDRTLSTA